MQRVALATRSAHKAAEIREVLRTTHVELVSLAELGVAESAAEDAVENAETFIGNAVAKARYFAAVTGLPTIADDSGLEVEALDGRPGVRTRRFAIDHGYTGPSGHALDQANNQLLLEKLRAVPDDRRSARYVCAAAFASPVRDSLSPTSAECPHTVALSEHLVTALGTCSGSITREPRGAGGFGYDPLFLLPDLAVTFAELSAEQKNARSHRARAFRALAVLL